MSRFFPLMESSQASMLAANELDQADIPCIKKLNEPATWFDGKPEGKLGNWTFRRQETSWRAEAPYDRKYKGLEKSVAIKFMTHWHDDEIHIHAAIHTQLINQVFAFDIYSIECLNAFAALIRSLEAQKDAPTETPAETMAAPTDSKPPLYQTIVNTLAHWVAEFEASLNSTEHMLVCVLHKLSLRNSSFPDPAERAWILANLEDIMAKYPAASQTIGLDETITLFKK